MIERCEMDGGIAELQFGDVLHTAVGGAQRDECKNVLIGSVGH